MTSTSIYTPFLPDQYCVYHTTYSGKLLPQNYIGSSSVDNVLNKNYHGSVVSERYKSIWLSELKLHPELFSTVIVSYHDTRSNATYKELQVQRTLNVVKSELFVNRSYASVYGFTDTTYTPEEKEVMSKKLSTGHANRTPEEKAKTSKKMSDARKGKKQSEEHISKRSAANTGLKRCPRSDEYRTKQSVAHTGRKRGPQSTEHRNKLSSIFFFLISTKKSYTKRALTRYFPEFKQFY